MSTACAGVRRSAWSTTLPVSAGNVCAIEGVANATSASHKTARSALTSAGGIEVDRRRLLRRGGRFERNLWLGAVEDLGADRVGEGADPRVIAAHRIIVVAARRVDAILGAFQLVLQ